MTDAKLSQKFLKELGKIDPDASGSILVSKQGKTLVITGSLYSALPDVNETLLGIALKLFPKSAPLATVKNLRKAGLHVVVADDETRTSVQTVEEAEGLLDEVRVIYQGELPLSAIKARGEYKRENWNTFRKVEAIVGVVGFIAPIVLDQNLQIIDGNLRFSIAQELLKTGKTSRDTVPVVVIDDAGLKADFLRLVLNRSAEFQRWKYDEVDAYLDAVPQALPLLEPLGLFGERILPGTFFGQTVLDYEIHEDFKSQQAFYKQEYGLAKWAEIQRERAHAAHAAKRKSKIKKPTPEMTSLFDLQPKEEDFIPTYDIEAEKRDHVLTMRDVAGTITDNYDTKRKAEKEAKGQAWQTTRRSPKKVIADLKASVDVEDADEETNEDD